ncbi:hypothetical protein SEA_AIKOCARSON_47 [Gordonia phage AikoCarson]|nr:hypothetical protein SEA_AIKOCARSON_47 [Gordonia phage AikoCarson]
MKIYYLAICQNCEPQRPMPFEDEGKRDEWAKAHAKATKHAVALGVRGEEIPGR